MWGEGVPLPAGGGVWRRGYAPSPENLWISDIEMVSFCAFWVVFFYRLVACFARQKSGAFGLPKLKLTAACAHAEMEKETETERERKGKAEIKNLSKVQIILH